MIIDGQVLEAALASNSVSKAKMQTDSVGSDEVNTSTGSDSATIANDIEMDEHSFFPNLVNSNSLTHAIGVYQGAVTGTTVGHFHITNPPSGTTSAEWRFITASDNPEIWIAIDSMGQIFAAWCQDVPTKSGGPGTKCDGCTSVRLKAADLENIQFTQDELNRADSLIARKKLRLVHRLYRALEEKAGRPAPSLWILNEMKYVGGKLMPMSVQDKADRVRAPRP